MSHGEAGKGKRDVCFGTCQSFGIPLSLTLKSEIRVFLSSKRSKRLGISQ